MTLLPGFALASVSLQSSLLLAPGGKLLVAGQYGVSRYLDSGAPDMNFGVGGNIIQPSYDVGSGYMRPDHARVNKGAATVASDGAVIALSGGAPGYVHVSRFNGSGMLGSEVALESNSLEHLIAATADGRFILARSVVRETVMGQQSDIWLQRLTSDAAVDPTFGDQGVVRTVFAPSSSGQSWAGPTAVMVAPDGAILVASQGSLLGENASTGFVRYRSDGQLDGTFGTGGIQALSFESLPGLQSQDTFPYPVSVKAMLAQADGKVVAVGSITTGAMTSLSPDALPPAIDAFMFRLNANGSLDTTFGEAGTVRINGGNEVQEIGKSIFQMTDGSLVVAYAEQGSETRSPMPHAPRVVLTGWTADGTVNTAFGDGGQLMFNGKVADVLVDEQGRVLVAGEFDVWGEGTLSQAIMRLNADGSLDQTFGGRASIYIDNQVLTPRPSVTGTSGDDNLLGLFGSSIKGGAGNDRIAGYSHGSADVVVYDAPRSNFEITRNGNDLVVRDLTGRYGTDTLGNIQRIQFSDGRLAFDNVGLWFTNTDVGFVAEIIGAIFGPAAVRAHPEYVTIGLDLITGTLTRGGMNKLDLVQLALDERLGAAAAPEAVVDLLYTNVVGQAPSAADLGYFTSLLADGTYTPASLAVMAAQTGYNHANIDFVGLTSDGLAYA